jgi:hypothetical protein
MTTGETIVEKIETVQVIGCLALHVLFDTFSLFNV